MAPEEKYDVKKPGTNVIEFEEWQNKRQKGILSSITMYDESFIERLIDLPEDLLLKILSDLPMECIVPFCLSFKKLYHLWKKVPDMVFNVYYGPKSWEDNKNAYMKFIENTLYGRDKDSRIRKFHAWLQYDDYPVDFIHLCLFYAIGHNVEDLYLDCQPDYYEEYYRENLGYGERYVTPRYVFNSRTLVSLTLAYCEFIDLPLDAHLPCLKRLELICVEFVCFTLEDLISICPLLEDLEFEETNTTCNMDIIDKDSHLKTVTLAEFNHTDLKEVDAIFFAPSLTSLHLKQEMPRRRYIVKDLSSMIVASFDFNPDDYDNIILELNGSTPFLHFLDQIHHVKELKLCAWCIMNLSIRETRGLATSVFFKITRLELTTGLQKCEIPGMAYILKNFTSLAVLIVQVSDDKSYVENDDHFFEGEFDYDEKEYWKSHKLSSSGLLQNLVTVKFNNFMGSESVPPEGEAEVVDDIIVKCENEIEFLKFLLKHSCQLKTMDISITNQFKELQTKLGLLVKLHSKMLEFPRPSPTAQVLIH